MKICIATSTRADWGLLSPLAKRLDSIRGVTLQILATNMHLSERYGHTADEILADGFRITEAVPMPTDGDTGADKAHAMAACLAGCADALSRMAPDILVILGDRYEMLSVASAAAIMRIPIAHIAGGETTEGAIDDNIRHAITMLSSLHFTAAEPYRERVLTMGKPAHTVFNAGALGVWNAMHHQLMSHRELAESLGFDFEDKHLFVATFHPATLDYGASPATRAAEMLAAIDRFPDYKTILTYPNNDAGSADIIHLIEGYAATRPGRVLLIKSLGKTRYLSALSFAAAVIGNSSSGIVEVPATGVPTVDIGIRQKGRLCGPSVIHCGDTADEISQAISLALSPAHLQTASRRENPYYRDDTVDFIADKLLNHKNIC